MTKDEKNKQIEKLKMLMEIEKDPALAIFNLMEDAKAEIQSTLNIAECKMKMIAQDAIDGSMFKNIEQLQGKDGENIKGDTGKDGIAGKDGETIIGPPGPAGKDKSPDSPLQIAKKLLTITKPWIPAELIKGLPTPTETTIIKEGAKNSLHWATFTIDKGKKWSNDDISILIQDKKIKLEKVMVSIIGSVKAELKFYLEERKWGSYGSVGEALFDEVEVKEDGIEFKCGNIIQPRSSVFFRTNASPAMGNVKYVTGIIYYKYV